MYNECTLFEIKTYRKLQGEPFDFGSGLIIPECYGEDLYYRRAINNYPIDEKLEVPIESDLEKHMKVKSRSRKRYKRKTYEDKAHLEMLKDIHWSLVVEKNNDDGDIYLSRCYRNRGSSYHKKASNKAVRRYNKKLSDGGNYRKCYDYWWEIW